MQCKTHLTKINKDHNLFGEISKISPDQFFKVFELIYKMDHKVIVQKNTFYNSLSMNLI